MSSSRASLAKSLIPMEEIRLATHDFSRETLIGGNNFGNVYRGQLSERWQNQTAAFRRLYRSSYQGHDHELGNVLEMISRFEHDNIIPFIGYCNEDDEMIIAFGYAINGSLQDHLQDPNKRRGLTWAQRLKICIGAAKGLEYLHSGARGSQTVIHKNIKATNILLDDNMEAKLCDFGLTSWLELVRPHSIHTTYVGNAFYMDPSYHESGILTKESDVYSFGVLLFETLSGMLATDLTPQTLINLVRRYSNGGLDQIIDPYIRSQVDSRSFNVFKKVAYQCISLKSKDRPKMNAVVQRIKEASDIQGHSLGPASTITIRINQYQNLKRFLIPLKEVNLATRYLSPETRVGVGGSGVVYKGQLSEHWQNRTAAFKRIDPSRPRRDQEFRNEVEMMSSFNHENIIPFIGYCDEGNERIIVSEYAINGSLDQYLKDPNRIRSLTWEQRLKICLGAARGLRYLHSGLGEQTKVIHRGVNSSNILLDANLEAKLCCFVLSMFVHENQLQDYEPAAGTPFYLDPIYNESGIVMTESDVYSFGVVLFEMLSGMLSCDKRSIGDDHPQTLVNLVRHYYDTRLESIIDPRIRAEIKIHSFDVFKEIAYRCISLNLKDRPTMNRIIKRIEKAMHMQIHGASSAIATTSHQCQNLDSLKIPLEEIKLATRNFSVETQIGDGGFGMVYKGQLSYRCKNHVVAIKRLDPKGHQGHKEFLTELKLISSFHHQNIIPFVGYCDEQNEMIIVYEYACNHSLDYHLQDSTKRHCLTWIQRLKICLGVARGLNYLHSSLGDDGIVIHKDIKSGNILLDEHLEAKICDFGLSKQLPANEKGTHFYTDVAGTNCYLDPIYQESGIVRKGSDVYSFGIVLFEILSGMLAYHRKSFGDYKPQPLINLVRRYYNNGFERLVDPVIRDQTDSRCFLTFKELAYRCISYDSKERPTMEIVIESIEDAIDFQVTHILSKELDTDQVLWEFASPQEVEGSSHVIDKEVDFRTKFSGCGYLTFLRKK